MKKSEQEFLAHSENPQGEFHILKDHLKNTAEMASAFAGKFGCEKIGEVMGLLHDLGKYHPDFQAYLKREDIRKGPNHSGAGAIEAIEIGLQLAAFPIACHHGGLTNRAKLKSRLKKDPVEKSIHQKSIESAKKDMPEISQLPSARNIIPPHINSFVGNRSGSRKLEFLLRMLFSSLVDADYLDTEKHFKYETSALRESSPTDFSLLLDMFTKDQESMMEGKSGKINGIRKEIYHYCLEASQKPPGIFRLTVPTGGGKTRSSLGFALKHALTHNKSRIIYSIPYTSIIEQNSKVFKDILGEENVLEHHSSVVFDEKNENSCKLRLASENWDFPIIVTTNVQLFESLFSNKSSRCRKLHNIADSVIILDEIQTLPLEILNPSLDILQTLAEDYGVTVVLCTATQPAVDFPNGFKGLKEVADIIPSPERYFDELVRVEYSLPFIDEKWDWDRVMEEMTRSNQALCVLNTKKDASELMSALKEEISDEKSLFHLSSSMCPVHRKEVINKILSKLKNKEDCYLVSTQVVEAGVDIDFPLVMRALGPLDRIVQTAGRCNRENKMKSGKVIVFRTETGRIPPGQYRSGRDEARIMLSENIDLNNPETYERYFKRLYTTINLDRLKIQDSRENWDFEETAKNYRLIKDDTIPVVVRHKGHEAQIDKLVEKLRFDPVATRATVRKLQLYMVNIRRYKLPEYQGKGLIKEIAGDLYEWCGRYDPLLGLCETGLNPGSLII